MSTRETKEHLPDKVRVYYALEGKLHVLTTPEFPYVMHSHKELKSAFETLAVTVNALVRANEGVDVTYVPRDSFANFSRAVRGDHALIEPVITLELREAARAQA